MFGAGKAVFRPVACNQVPGARGRGQGTETLAELWQLAALARLVFRSALTPEHAEGRWTGDGPFFEPPAFDGAGISLRDDPRGARHWRASSRRKLHMRTGRSSLRRHEMTGDIIAAAGLPRPSSIARRRGSRCSLVLRPSRSTFSNSLSKLTDVGPVELWATRQRRPSVAANPQGVPGCCIGSVARAHCGLRLGCLQNLTFGRRFRSG